METTFIDAGPGVLWFIAVAIGALTLGAAIAYGAVRYRQRTARNDAAAETGAKQIYDHPNRD